MGAEGGGGFEGRVRGRIAIGASPERGLEETSWISGIINPEKLKRYREYPALEGHSTEWIIMEALLARLVEQGPDMDPEVRARLRNLVGILRAAFYPNMDQREQEIVHDLITRTTSVDFSSLQYEVTPEASEDIRWFWRTFGLQVPSRDQVRGLPESLQGALRSLSPSLQADS